MLSCHLEILGKRIDLGRLGLRKRQHLSSLYKPLQAFLQFTLEHEEIRMIRQMPCDTQARILRHRDEWLRNIFFYKIFYK